MLMEFHELMMAQEFISTGGIDYARELLEKSLGTQKAVDIINRLTSSLQVRPFDFIRRTDPAHLQNFIQQEHPQTIALILAYLEPNKASVILGSLPSEIQSDVAKRIAGEHRAARIRHRAGQEVIPIRWMHPAQGSVGVYHPQFTAQIGQRNRPIGEQGGRGPPRPSRASRASSRRARRRCRRSWRRR